VISKVAWILKAGSVQNIITINQIQTDLSNNNNQYALDVTLDRNIIPVNYNQVDLTLPMTFYIDNIVIIQSIVLTDNKLRLIYYYDSNNKTYGSILTHKYRINESIPYRINTITPINNYYYEMNIKKARNKFRAFSSGGESAAADPALGDIQI
jgi:hypothetical protein